MKKIYLILFFQVIAMHAFSQQEIKITEQLKSMSKGSQNSYNTEIPQARQKEVIAAWKKYVKRETKNPVEETNGEVSIQGSVISNITAGPLTIYARFLEDEQGVRLTSFFTEDDSVFFSSVVSEEKSTAITKFLKDFVVQQYKVAVNHELETEKKKLSILEDDLENLIKVNEKAEKKINENNRRIDKNKDGISANRKEQEARAGDVADQKETVRSLSGSKGDEKTSAEKKLKDLEKEKRKLEKQGEKFHSENEDLDSDIKQLQRNMEKNEDAQKTKKDDISQQKTVVHDTEKKLNNIK